MKSFGHSATTVSTTDRCPAPTLVHSKYETMVTNFSAWVGQVLESMVDGKGVRKTLQKTLVKQYQNDFVPNGKHKHALVMGANMAKLKLSTIRELRRIPVLQELLQDLGYDWFGYDRRTEA